ncbi:MAG: extracellular solute-binding protein [Spirochaetaceae bacterium]|nr:MAG: extracellular solute-binding protein [Spirochaetaceae bacterium]
MKKTLTVLLLTLLAVSLFAGGQQQQPQAAAQPVTREINVLLWDDPYPRALAAMLPEFEAATGIRVNIEMLQPPQVLTKTAVSVTANSTDYDVVGIDEGNVPVFAELLLPFAQWPQGQVFPKTDPASVTPKMLNIGTWDGVQLGIPINGNLYVWMTRKDLIENPDYRRRFRAEYGYDLGVPETLDQLLDMGTFFHSNGIANGFGPFNGGPAGVFSEAIYMWHAFGTDFINFVDGTFKIVLDEDRAVEGMEFYKKLMAISPPGAETMAHVERQAAFAADPKGVFSMFIWPAQIAAYENPDTSMVSGKIAYSAPPAGPRGHGAVTGAWAITIPRASRNQEAAAEFIYWWSSQEIASRLVEANTIPARTDALTNPAFVAAKPHLPALAASMDVAISRPRFREIGEVQDVIKLRWTEGITGARDTREAVRMIVRETNEILRRAGY